MKTKEEILIDPKFEGLRPDIMEAMQEYSNQQNMELIEALQEARAQLEYLDDKFQKTGTTASVLARISTILNKQGV